MTVLTQEGDVDLFQTTDDGDISVVNGVMAMSGGLETTLYLSIFGGNQKDDGRDGNFLTWWGNSIENESSKKYVSETQNLIESIPLISSNLLRIEEAVLRDLAWMLSESIASEITVGVSVPALNRVQIDIVVLALGEEQLFSFTENWKLDFALFTPDIPDEVISITVEFRETVTGESRVLADGTTVRQLQLGAGL